jgi:hypothetical protein
MTVADVTPGSLYFPSTAVVVPWTVPLMSMVTPGNGSPSSAAVTMPVTVRVWAKISVEPKRKKHKKAITLFI